VKQDSQRVVLTGLALFARAVLRFLALCNVPLWHELALVLGGTFGSRQPKEFVTFLAHTEEIKRSSTCGLSRANRKWPKCGQIGASPSADIAEERAIALLPFRPAGDSVGAATSAGENVINALDRDVRPQHGAENSEF
jgi:hypothetical protein